jgi:hypothetical protein
LNWEVDLHEAVNKRLLSTGETGEFASKKLGSRPQPGVGIESARNLSSNRRELAGRKKLPNVGDNGLRAKTDAVNEIGGDIP